MSFLKRLFGGESARKIPGAVFSVSSASVRSHNIQAVPQLLDSLAALTAKHSTPHFAEVTFDGFDHDPRPIDEIPEVAAWARLVQETYPDWLQWLTPGAMLRHLMCIVPGLAEHLPNGQVSLNFGAPGFQALLPAGANAAASRLRNLGCTEPLILEVFLPAINLNRTSALLGQNQLGKHYQVVAL
ncbi:MAG: hypothetical protein P0120_13300 [Nitrospira sp.]|nr:hypothetical protein [Nitrospira sp.]